MDNRRGIIKNRGFANQVRDYSGLRFGNITPTDIDGMIEYKNICYVYIEIKYLDAELPFGQRLALERQTDDMQKVKPTITVIVSHNSKGDIDVGNSIVTEFRWLGQWRKVDSIKSARQVIERFVNWCETSHNYNRLDLISRP